MILVMFEVLVLIQLRTFLTRCLAPG